MAAFKFSHPIEVRYSDLDPQGHLNNAIFLTYIEQARIHYLIHLGLFSTDQSFMDVGIILADAHVASFSPIYFGQQVRVSMGVTRIGNSSMSIEYRIFDAATDLNLAKAETVVVTYDYRQGHSIRVPDAWRKTIAQFEQADL